jgi:hypothetical protein
MSASSNALAFDVEVDPELALGFLRGPYEHQLSSFVVEQLRRARRSETRISEHFAELWRIVRRAPGLKPRTLGGGRIRVLDGKVRSVSRSMQKVFCTSPRRGGNSSAYARWV